MIDKQWLLKINNCLLIVLNCADCYFIMASPLDNNRSLKNLNTLLLRKFFNSDYFQYNYHLLDNKGYL